MLIQSCAALRLYPYTFVPIPSFASHAASHCYSLSFLIYLMVSYHSPPMSVLLWSQLCFYYFMKSHLNSSTVPNLHLGLERGHLALGLSLQPRKRVHLCCLGLGPSHCTIIVRCWRKPSLSPSTTTKLTPTPQSSNISLPPLHYHYLELLPSLIQVIFV